MLVPGREPRSSARADVSPFLNVTDFQNFVCVHAQAHAEKTMLRENTENESTAWVPRTSSVDVKVEQKSPVSLENNRCGRSQTGSGAGHEVSITAVKHHDQTASCQRKPLICLTLACGSSSLKEVKTRTYACITMHQRKSGQEVKQGRNLEAGADAEAMEGAACWLAPHGLLSCFLTEPSTSPGMALPAGGWALSVSH
ncbi:uncharacterized protein LOC101834311 isoform X8 [Mesocricetus auratus]|uniref:Uncharacterized protein LOC101834311 isoform X8 n=1 Tax=Mesocricetus auratus TaxID=10036 RepID=A0ABM2WT68_MESAU|nr:uncharacterized protein LOC101834311 isoform X8 [Mesocricetus auratus]